jgi:hypothetical protein
MHERSARCGVWAGWGAGAAPCARMGRMLAALTSRTVRLVRRVSVAVVSGSRVCAALRTPSSVRWRTPGHRRSADASDSGVKGTKAFSKSSCSPFGLATTSTKPSTCWRMARLTPRSAALVVASSAGHSTPNRSGESSTSLADASHAGVSRRAAVRVRRIWRTVGELFKWSGIKLGGCRKGARVKVSPPGVPWAAEEDETGHAQ